MVQNLLTAVVQKRLGLAIAIWGEAGIGKSHQVKVLLQSVTCQNLSFHATTPLAAIALALPKPKKLPLWAEANLKRLASGEAVEGSSAQDSLNALLSGLAPFILHFEDIHEADQDRLAFLQSLAKIVLKIKGVALLVTSRKEPPEPFAATKLEPLSRQASDRLLEAELNTSLPKEALKWICDKAAGNPLYTLEYLRYLTRQGFLWSDGKSWHWRKPPNDIMPVTIEALIEQLLTQAKSEPLQSYVLEAKALLPLGSSDEVVQKVAGVNQQVFHRVVTELTQHGIFKNNDFAHPLFREVALKTLSAEKIRNLARQAMNILADKPERAAMFLEQAGLEPIQALRFLEHVVEKVKARNEGEAARFLAKAVDYASGEEKAHLALSAAQGLRHVDHAESMRLAKLVLTIQPKKLEAIYLLAELLTLQQKMDEVDDLLARLPDSERRGISFTARLVRLRAVAGDHQGVVRLWQQYPEVATVHADTTLQLAWAMAALSEYEQARAIATQGLALPDLDANHRSRLITIFGIICADQADYSNAEKHFAEALALARVADFPRNLASALANHAHVLRTLGRYQEMLAQYEEAKSIALELGDSYLIGILQISIGQELIEFAAYERAEEAMLEGLSLLKNVSSAALVECEATLSRLYDEGNYPHGPILAVKHAQNALRESQRLQGQNPRAISVALLHMARAEIKQKNYIRAKERAEQALLLCEEKDLIADIPLAQMVLALALEGLGQSKLALEKLLGAKLACEQTGMSLEAQKIGLELDRLNKDAESARMRMQWFEERGLMNGVNIAKRYFPELADSNAIPQQTVANVRLEVLGTLQVTETATTPVRGRKRQELLALLLEARLSGRNEVSRLSLLDSLYPDEDERKASSSLKNLIHGLREIMGESVIVTTHTGYALACNSDAEQFLQTADTRLWRGAYLEGLELSDESSVQQSLYLALYDKTKALIASDPKEAARVGAILVEIEPYSIDYLKTYLSALRFHKQHGKLARHYQEARERLLELGEALPETWQAFLS